MLAETPPDDAPGLGVLVPDRLRAILVITGGCELAVALRETVDRAYVVAREVRAAEALAGITACEPWPWMVVGDVGWLDPRVRATLRRRPALVLWLGVTPAGLPRHTRSFARVEDLAAAVREAVRASVAGLRLAVGTGIEMPDGRLARSAGLEALVANHPRPLDAAASTFRSARQLLLDARVPLRPMRTSGGSVRLQRWAG